MAYDLTTTGFNDGKLLRRELLHGNPVHARTDENAAPKLSVKAART